MLRSFFQVAVVGAVVTLAACSGSELADTRGLAPSGSTYQDTLYQGYLERSEHEYGYGHYVSSDAFALKARAALAGENVQPWPINSRVQPFGMVSDRIYPEISEARAALMDTLNSSSRDEFPAETATALVMFDCWLEEESYVDDPSEADQPAHAKECRDAFFDAMTKILVIVEAAPEPAAPAPEPAMAAPQSVLLFFDWDSAQLNDETSTLISAAYEASASFGNAPVQIIGHADRSGSNDYNMRLSERRATVVADTLRRLGLADSAMSVTWKGETDPLISTADGVREPQNRRVQIVLGGN